MSEPTKEPSKEAVEAAKRVTDNDCAHYCLCTDHVVCRMHTAIARAIDTTLDEVRVRAERDALKQTLAVGDFTAQHGELIAARQERDALRAENERLKRDLSLVYRANADLEAFMSEVDAIHADRDHWKAVADYHKGLSPSMLVAENERLKALLRKCEWAGRRWNSAFVCPCCGRLKDGPHAASCDLAKAIGGKQ